MSKNRIKVLCCLFYIGLLFPSCENNLEITLPHGPKGDKGEAGMSAYELWLQVNGNEGSASIEDFFNSIKGKDGIDGTNGKSAYELWKEAVDRDEMTNIDGTKYTEENTWEYFLKWLQGGDVLVLYKYWLNLTGNEGKSIEEFINSIFDCLCNNKIGTVSLEILNHCYLKLTLNGTPGMTVKAMNSSDHSNFVILTESPSGTYSASVIPRRNESYTILIQAEMEGKATIEKTIEVEGTSLLAVFEPLSISQISEFADDLNIALVKRRFINNTNAPLNITAIRSNNILASALQNPQSPVFPLTAIIPANGYVEGSFYRDSTQLFESGHYVITFITTTECGMEKTYTIEVENLQSS